MTEKFSNEFLNAFVDVELSIEERSRVHLALNRDEALNREICELRKIQDMVRLSYQDPPAPPARAQATGTYGYRGLGVAAGIALAVGVIVGWVLHEPRTQTTSAVPTTAAPNTTVSPPLAPRRTMPVRVARAPMPIVAAPDVESVPIPADIHAPVASGDTEKVLIHVNSGSAAHHRQVLDEIEGLARYYREQGQRAHIEVVINGEGLNLVRADVTAHAERIRALLQAYENVTFAACLNTIDRLRREQGVIARLLPGVIVIDSGVAQIMRRQQQGWAYIRV